MSNADVMDRLAGLDHYERWGVVQDGDEDATTLDSCAVELDELDRVAGRHRVVAGLAGPTPVTGPLTTTEAHLLRRYLTRTGCTPAEVDAAITGDVARIAAATTDLHQLAWHVDLWATARSLAGRPCPAGIDLADRIRTTAEQERTP